MVAEIATLKGVFKMDFLKEILGDDLFEQVKTKVSSYNEKTDKDKKVSIVNVNNGEFVAKAKYDQLKADFDNTKTSLETANTTIKDLKKTNGDNADLQAKITAYETEKAEIEKTHKEAVQKLLKESAIKEELYKEKVKFPELLISKYDLFQIILDEKGEKVVSGISEQTKGHKEKYKELFGETEKETKGVKSFNAGGESTPGTTASQGTNLAKVMNENSKTTESKFFN